MIKNVLILIASLTIANISAQELFNKDQDVQQSIKVDPLSNSVSKEPMIKKSLLTLDKMETIKIGLQLTFKGSAQLTGISAKNAAFLAVSHINAAGGILGKPIELVIKDDESSSPLALSVAKELVDAQDIVAVLGFCNTHTALAAADIYQKAQIPMISTVASASQLSTRYKNEPVNYVFTVSLNTEKMASLMMHDALVRKGLTQLAIFSDQSELGKNGHIALLKKFKSHNLKPIVDLKFDIGLPNIKEIVNQVITAKPDGILLFGYATEMGEIVKELRTAGLLQPVIGSRTMSNKQFIEKAGMLANGCCMPQTFIQSASNSSRRLFIAEYIELFKPLNRQIEDPSVAAQTYDALHLLAAAINHSKSIDGPTIVSALEHLASPFDGIIKKYTSDTFSLNDHEAIEEDSVVMGMYKNERVIYAYRDDSQKLMK